MLLFVDVFYVCRDNFDMPWAWLALSNTASSNATTAATLSQTLLHHINTAVALFCCIYCLTSTFQTTTSLRFCIETWRFVNPVTSLTFIALKLLSLP